MLSFFPTVCFFIQSIFLYFEREILNINNSDFWIIARIIFFNTVILVFINFLTEKKFKVINKSKISDKLSNKQNSLIIFFIYLFLFFIQVLIRGNIPAFTGLFASEVSYTKWPVSPFSGFMSILFLLILGERISVWSQLRKDPSNNINNIILVMMSTLSLLMLRRDLFALLVFGYSIKLYVLTINLFKRFLNKLKVNKFALEQSKNIILIMLLFLFVFSIVGGLRGHGTGVNREYWKILSLYVATPLSNSLTLINYEESGYLGFAHFYLGGSELGGSILNFIGIQTDNLPRENFVLPQFNVISALGTYYQVFGKNFYIFAIGFYSGLLRLIEIYWRSSEPILFSLILLLASGSIWYHYFGTITITLVFPFIYLIKKLIIRLK